MHKLQLFNTKLQILKNSSVTKSKHISQTHRYILLMIPNQYLNNHTYFTKQSYKYSYIIAYQLYNIAYSSQQYSLLSQTSQKPMQKANVKQQQQQNNLKRKKERTLSRKTDFFVFNYVDFNDDIRNLQQITDVELELFSYGLFKKQAKLKLFREYVDRLLLYFMDPNHKMRSFKFMLKGFDMGLTGNGLLQKLAQGLKNISQKEGYENHNLMQLWIHTSYLKNCDINDFSSIFGLLFELNDEKLQDLSMQFGFWKFKNRQPDYLELDNHLRQRFVLNEIHTCYLKHFRFDISGWYYEKFDALALLGFKMPAKQWDKLSTEMQNKLKFEKNLQGYEYKLIETEITKFHKLIEIFVEALVSLMKDIKTFEIDMRNYDPTLKTSVLKGRLANIKKDGRNEASLVSMSKRFYKTEQQAKQEQKKQFKLTPMM